MEIPRKGAVANAVEGVEEAGIAAVEFVKGQKPLSRLKAQPSLRAKAEGSQLDNAAQRRARQPKRVRSQLQPLLHRPLRPRTRTRLWASLNASLVAKL